MSNEQIAHDLAVAKLYGSDLPTDKLVEQYRQYFKEINDYLKPQSKPKPAQVFSSPI